MREILFRGKRVDNGEWIYGFLTTQFRKHSQGALLSKIQSNVFGVGKHLVDTETVGQYTGLTDKFKNKKWQGDIFECDEHRFVIDWDDKELAWYANDIFEPDYSTMLSEFSPDDIAVIGNIHDNLELLEGSE